MTSDIVVIPDTHAKDGVPIDHFKWIANYIKVKRPGVVIHLGDHWCMPSLSSYDAGKRAAENRRFASDIDSGNTCLRDLTGFRSKSYSPSLTLLRGNHEQRIERAANDQAWLHGTVGYHLFNDRQLGWKPVPFLKPIEIAGIWFCHYFPSGNSKWGPASARAMVLKQMASCIAGHKQGLDSYVHSTSTRMIRGIIAGSCYQHEEEYLTSCHTKYWRGILHLHEVDGRGGFGLTEVSLAHLEKRYG